MPWRKNIEDGLTIMEEFKLMARLLAAIRVSEDKEVFDLNLVSEQVLNTTARRRDKMAMKLQNAGYITGIVKLDGIDNLEEDIIMWNESKPEVTIKGLEYIQNSEPLRKQKETAQLIPEHSGTVSLTLWM